MEVRITMLGRVELTVDGARRPIRGRRERSVLALLVAAGGKVVSADRLIEDVWSDTANQGTANSLRVAVSRLRALLEPHRVPGQPAEILVSVGGGYSLVTSPDAVDIHRFTTLVEQAQDAEHGDTLELCDRALGLWGGKPFGDAVDCEPLRAEATRLEEVRLSAMELRAASMLTLGRHQPLIADLESLVVTYPLRERFHELLARALYRSGRQADALAALRLNRRVLAEELGADPRPEMIRLEADVLQQRPDTGPVTETTPSSDTSTVLVGRTAELAVLTEALDEALNGRSSTVLIAGAAGIGKSRLAAEAATHGKARGANVIVGRAHPVGVCPPYWVWLPIIRELAGPAPAPIIAALLNATGDPDAVDFGAQALRTYDAIVGLLVQAAAQRPLVVVLEDLQWADDTSVRMLSYAVDALREARLLVVATIREIGPPSAALSTCLATLARRSMPRILLEGLNHCDVRALIGTADDELASVVAERTDGNPFFALELVRLLRAEKRLDPGGAREVQVPRGITDVLRWQLQDLPPAVVRTMSIAAVIGRHFDLPVLAQVSESTNNEIIDLLDAAKPWVIEEPDRADRYRFAHALVRETLIALLPHARQARFHAAVAVALVPYVNDDAGIVTQVAHHFAIGATVLPELTEQAIEYALAAARRAEACGALDEALVQWESAMTTLSRARLKAPDRRYEVLLGLGRARNRRDDTSGAWEALNKAIALGRELGDVTRVAEAAISVRSGWHWREWGVGDPSLIQVLRECIAHLESGALRTRVLGCLAVELSAAWRNEEAEEAGRRAIESARDLNSPELLADLISMRVLMFWSRPGSAAEYLALEHELLAHSPALSPERELYVRFAAIGSLLQLGELSGVEDHLGRFAELAGRLRHTSAEMLIPWLRFMLAVAADDRTTAARLLDGIRSRLRIAPGTRDDELVRMAALRTMGPGAPLPDDLLAIVRRGHHGTSRTYIAHLLVESGRPDEAQSLLGEPSPADTWDIASLCDHCQRVDVLTEAGPSAALKLSLDRIIPWRHEFALYGIADYLGSVHYFVGRGLQGMGDLPGARAAFRQAVVANRTAGAVVWQRRAEQRLAALTAAAPDRLRVADAT
jgi:DNA-binding SARP family transcriptional activator/tetratricopeptide (TPR) repeat protein